MFEYIMELIRYQNNIQYSSVIINLADDPLERFGHAKCSSCEPWKKIYTGI